MLKQRFVRFLFPGLIVSESTSVAVRDDYTEQQAIKDAEAMKPDKPYAFQFVVKGREDHELDSRVIQESGLYFIGGRVSTVDEIEARNDPRDSILIGNMRRNDYHRVVETGRGTYPLGANDRVV